MWKDWLVQLFKPNPSKYMSTEKAFQASSTGRLYLDKNEFFKTKKIKKTISKLLESSTYKHIKEDQARVKVEH